MEGPTAACLYGTCPDPACKIMQRCLRDVTLHDVLDGLRPENRERVAAHIALLMAAKNGTTDR